MKILRILTALVFVAAPIYLFLKVLAWAFSFGAIWGFVLVLGGPLFLIVINGVENDNG